MQPIQFFAARAEDGALVPGAAVDVFVSGTQARAALFADSLGSMPIGNPAQADQSARVFFYSATSRVDIRIHRGAYVGPLMRDVVVTDPDDVLTLTNGLYRTVAQGLAATLSGKTFQVIAAEEEAAYAIYENVGGVAVDTGKRVPARYLLDKVEAASLRNVDAARAYAEGAQTYAGRNFGPMGVDPLVNPLGDPLVAGDRYFNIANDVERVYTGDAWYTPNADGQAIQVALGDATDSDKGSGMVGFKRSGLSEAITTVNLMLSGLKVNIWEYAKYITYKPGVLPSTWDWTPARVEALSDLKEKGGGWIRYPCGAYPHSVFTKCHAIGDAGDGSSASYITALPRSSSVPYGLVEIEPGAVSCSHIVGLHFMGSAQAGFALPAVNPWQWGLYAKAQWDADYFHGGWWYSACQDVRFSNFNQGVWSRGGYTNAHYQRVNQFLTFSKVFIQVPNGGEALRLTGQHGQIEWNGGAAEGRDGAVAALCIKIDWDPDPSTMADPGGRHGENIADVAGVGNAVQTPYNVNFSNSFSIQKSVSGIFARNCKQVSIRGAWVERIAKLITLGTNGRLSVGTAHLANAADGSVGGAAGTGYLYSLGTNAYLDFESGSEPIGTFDNYLDPTTNLNNILGLDVRGMASGDTTGMFKASGFKTVTLVDGVVNLLAHKFATVNPSAAAPSQKLSFLIATAAPTEDVSFRPLAGPVTLTNTGNISLNGLTEFTVPQNGVVTLRRIAQVVGNVEWVLASCTPSMGTSVPNDGWYYTAGWKREKSNPSANNSMGWICVTAGIAGSTAVFKQMPNLAL